MVDIKELRGDYQCEKLASFDLDAMINESSTSGVVKLWRMRHKVAHCMIRSGAL